MKFVINKISYYIEDVLRSSAYGFVHSVYRKTINLQIDGRLAALQAEGSPLSPVSMITNLSSADMQALDIRKGSCVKLAGDCLTICPAADTLSTGPQSFSYADADRYDLRLPGGLSPQDCGPLAENIRTALSLGEKGGFQTLFQEPAHKTASLVLSAAKKHIENSSSLYHSKDYRGAAGELSQLLGLGSGLTPSGDDFLCGVLAGLKFSSMENSEFAGIIKSEIYEHLEDTIDISAAFLACALREQYSLAVKRLYHVPEATEIFSDFSAIGHSSGMDTLCGILYILELTQRRHDTKDCVP